MKAILIALALMPAIATAQTQQVVNRGMVTTVHDIHVFEYSEEQWVEQCKALSMNFDDATHSGPIALDDMVQYRAIIPRGRNCKAKIAVQCVPGVTGEALIGYALFYRHKGTQKYSHNVLAVQCG